MENDKGLRGAIALNSIVPHSFVRSLGNLQLCVWNAFVAIQQSKKRFHSMNSFSQVTRPIMNQRQLWRRGKCPGEQLEELDPSFNGAAACPRHLQQVTTKLLASQNS